MGVPVEIFCLGAFTPIPINTTPIIIWRVAAGGGERQKTEITPLLFLTGTAVTHQLRSLKQDTRFWSTLIPLKKTPGDRVNIEGVSAVAVNLR